MHPVNVNVNVNASKSQKNTNSQLKSTRQKAQPAKLSGFCDIVNQAALKKGKPVAKKASTKTTVKAIETVKQTTATTSMTSTETKRVDTWEEFREKKLAEMKQHKINVEQRMQMNRNIDGQMYWSQRVDKLKRYPKHEALHPSWYTENIYSNNSIDLETDDFLCHDDQYDSIDYDREMFHRKRAHIDTGYGYPKSRSCCFGSGYDERPKPVLMPKSSSFTGSSTRGMSNIRTMYSTVEEKGFVEMRRPNNQRNNFNRSGLKKFYCWENYGHQNLDKHGLYSTNAHHLDDNCYMKNSEVYHIERDRNYYKKPNIDINDVRATTNSNYIRNSWHNRNRSSSLYKVQNVNEINGNNLNEISHIPFDRKHQQIDSHQPYEEEYLIIHQNKPKINIYSARNSFDDPGSVSRRQSLHSNEMYPDFYNDKCGYLNRDKRRKCSDSLAYSERNRHRSKSMLEVKPPNRYDDSSSDSTIDDLYDFNFDYANQFDLDYRNNNAVNCDTSMFKEKNVNVNVDTYSKYRKSKMESIDDTDNDLNDVDFDDNNSQSEDDDDDKDVDINFNSLASPRHNRAHYQSPSNNKYLLSNRSAYDRFYDNYLSPTEFYPTSVDNNNQDISSPIRNSAIDDNNMYNKNNNVDPVDDGNGNLNISLINNIFSIYKPRKYSPVSSRFGNQKVCGLTKSMNVPSTVRPLGAPCNDFLTSMKRPLTITPSCFTTQKRNWIVPSSASMDQAHFKIIPEKTGLKISPLYRFGYEDDSKLRLKCTARPLLFPL